MRTARAAGVVLLLFLGGCAPRPVPPGVAPGAPAEAELSRDDPRRWEFWTAFVALDLRRAERRSPDGEHRRLVRALRQVLGGRMEGAESPLTRLVASSGDSLVRGISHIALSAALEYQGKWAALDDLSRLPTRTLLRNRRERVAIEAWAGAMRAAPPAEYAFPEETVTLPFLPAVTGTPVVNVKVNGVSRWFWMDTGSSISLLSASVATEAGVTPLTPDTLHMVTAVGVTSARPTVLHRLEVGGLVIANQPAAIVTDDDLALDLEGEGGLVRIDGVIGMDIIRRLNLEIDYHQHRVRIARPQPSGREEEEERNLLWLGYPLVRLEQRGGPPLYFGLDTGANRTYATEGLLKKLPKRWMRRERHRIAGFGGDTTLTVRALPRLEVSIGPRNFTLTGLPVHAPRRMGFVQIDGVLGNDTAAGLLVRIDVTNGVFDLRIPYGGFTPP
jgi:predicted aspartyl protease